MAREGQGYPCWQHDMMMMMIEYIWVWFGLVFWHINACSLFNAKSSLYIYIKYMICKHILSIMFLNKPELICLHTVKWFKVLLKITNN